MADLGGLSWSCLAVHNAFVKAADTPETFRKRPLAPLKMLLMQPPDMNLPAMVCPLL
jgi:hypothetical protein